MKKDPVESAGAMLLGAGIGCIAAFGYACLIALIIVLCVIASAVPPAS